MICCLTVVLKCQPIGQLCSKDPGDLVFCTFFLESGIYAPNVPQKYLISSFTERGWKTWAKVLILGVSWCVVSFSENPLGIGDGMTLDASQTSAILVGEVLWSENYGMCLSNCYVLKKDGSECAYATVSKSESKKGKRGKK